MANYGPLDQVTDHTIGFTFYDFPTATNLPYDFGAAGYAADATLNIAGQGEVQIFGVDSTGATIAVTIGGSSVTLNGTGSAFAKRDHLVVTNCYFKYNLPNAQNQTYFFTAVFSKGSGTAQQTVSWQNNTQQ